MNNLTTFEVFSGAASIIAFILATISLILKIWRTFRQKREKAEKDFDQELSRLHAAGKTVSARTDLGFFVLIELGSLRNLIASYRSRQTIFFLSAITCLVLSVLSESFTPNSNFRFWFGVLSLLASLICILLSAVIQIFMERLEKYTKSYERRIKEVWQRPIGKRAARNEK